MSPQTLSVGVGVPGSQPTAICPVSFTSDPCPASFEVTGQCDLCSKSRADFRRLRSRRQVSGGRLGAKGEGLFRRFTCLFGAKAGVYWVPLGSRGLDSLESLGGQASLGWSWMVSKTDSILKSFLGQPTWTTR